jgi:hypothetical protein
VPVKAAAATPAIIGTATSSVVGINGVDGGGFLMFNYDQNSRLCRSSGAFRIIVRGPFSTTPGGRTTPASQYR